jgi:MFS family permease
MAARASNPGRTLVYLALASMGWAFSFGLGAPLAGLWLRDAGYNAEAIGLNNSAYYFGVAVASFFVPLLMRRANRLCVAGGMLLDAATVALFPWCHGPAVWLVLRASSGVGTALSLIPMETLVNHDAPPNRRARHFAVYAVSVALGIALGNVAGLQLYHDHPRLAFALGGLVTLLATALALRGVPARDVQSEEGAQEGDTPPISPATFLGFGTGWAQGFLEGATFSFLSIYLLWLGYSHKGVSGLVGTLFVGVVLAQLPVAWLADRLGRLRIVIGCHAILLVGLVATSFCQAPVPLAVCLFLLGACCGALYPLGLALLGERVPSAGLARANAWYLACNCAGSLTGPWLCGKTIDRFGQRAQFVTCLASLFLVLGTWLAWSVLRRKTTPIPSSTSDRQRSAA